MAELNKLTINGSNYTFEDDVARGLATAEANRAQEAEQSLQTAINNKVDKVTGKGLSTNDYTNDEKAKLAGLNNYDDTQVRQLIAQTNANFANYYTKAESYSATEVDTLLRTQRQGQFVVVNTLPAPSADTMFKIYLVPSTNPETQNVKDEFVTLENNGTYSWEQMGSTAVDLSGYSTTVEMNAAIASALASYYTKSEVDEALGGKQNTIDDLANIRSGAQAGSTAVQPSTLNSVVKNTVAESGVYDVSANNDNTKFESLSALLGSANLNTLIPTDIRKGGMSIKFVQSSDNKYVQYRYIGTAIDATFTNVANWQGVDVVPAPNNRNLVESSGVAAITDVIGRNVITELNIGYINYSNGTIGASPNYSYSNNIVVQAGQVYAICCTNGSATPAAVAAYDSNGIYLQEYSVAASAGLKRFLYTVPENVHHIVVSGLVAETISAIQLSDEILNNFFILDNIKLVRKPYGINSNNGTPYTHIQSTSSTSDIVVSKGDAFFIKAGDYASTCVVAAYDSLGNYIYGLSIIGTGQSVSIDYCVPEGISKIVVCNNTYIEDNPVIIKKPAMLAYYDYSLTELSSRIDNTSPKIPITILNFNTGWIKLSNGSIQGGNNYRYSDPILVSEGDVLEYNGGVTSSVAVVAMYNSSAAASSDYVRVSSIAGTGEATNLEFTIPQGIVAIRLCDNITFTPLGNLSLYKRNPLYSDFTTVNDVKTIVSDNMFAPVSRNRIRISPTRKAVFSFNFDDLRTSDKDVFDIFQSYGFLPSYALNYLSITETNIKLYKEMYVKGCSILGHGSTASATQLKGAYTTLTELGFVINGWVTPSSVLPDNLKPLAASIYGYCFNVGSNAQNVLPSTTVGKYDENASRFNLARLSLEEWNIDANPSLVYLKACVDDAIANNLFITFYGHQIPSEHNNTDNTSCFTVEDLENLLQYIKTKVDNCQCIVLPTDEAVAYYYTMVNPT